MCMLTNLAERMFVILIFSLFRTSLYDCYWRRLVVKDDNRQRTRPLPKNKTVIGEGDRSPEKMTLPVKMIDEG